LWIEIGMAAVLAVCVTGWGVRRLRRQRAVSADPEPVRPVALPVPRPPSAPAPTIAMVRQSLQDFLRQHFQCSPGEVTPHDAEDCLRRGGVPEGLARSFAALLDTCQTAEFAPGLVTTSPSELVAYARQLMNRVTAALPEVAV